MQTLRHRLPLLLVLLGALSCACSAQASEAFQRLHTPAAIDVWSAGGDLAPVTSGKGGPVALTPGCPELVLTFHAVSGSAHPLFRYRLRGYDDGWTETREGVAHFWKLPPGDYQFDVEAALPDGSWPDQPTSMPVSQKPFFYQTWYAAVMVCVFVLAVGVELLRQREQLLKGQMGMVLEERNRIASDCHDTLMAGFAAVSWQLEATSKLLDTDAPEERATASSLELARSMISHCQAEARRIIWDLRNSDRITTKLSEALADAIDAHRLHSDTRTTLTVYGDEVTLSPAAVHHLTCIGQEALTNAMRHAHASAIQVQLHYETDSLCLTIRDNGCGFAMQHGSGKSGHFGIPVMEERTRKLGGDLRLTSACNKGTEVTVTVNFKSISQPTLQQGTVVPWIGV